MKAQSTKGHSNHTDNANLYQKIRLREIATQGITSRKVLDLFAGENKIWENIPTEKYYGIEVVKNKGRNLNADNRRIIPILDLSQYNIIDVDSYGIPIDQIIAIYENGTAKDGTIIIYTAIGNSMSMLNKNIIEKYITPQMYKKVKTIFNNKSLDFFYAFLYDMGVREVYEYDYSTGSFLKRYGYFVYKRKDM